MVNNNLRLDAAFRALADNTRREIIFRLAQGDALVSELADPFEMSLPAISKHLKVLENAGLISRHKEGRIRRCHLEPAVFQQLSDWMDFYRQFWNIRLDNLSQLIETQNKK